MARPKKDESIRRTKNVMVRFTDVEYALVSCSAEQAGYPVAVYVRKQAITEKLHVHYNIVADIAELRDFARQLSHTSYTPPYFSCLIYSHQFLKTEETPILRKNMAQPTLKWGNPLDNTAAIFFISSKRIGFSGNTSELGSRILIGK